LHASLQTPRTF
nr:immunoglobulin light chain junction region [Macaca mulatta]